MILYNETFKIFVVSALALIITGIIILIMNKCINKKTEKKYVGLKISGNVCIWTGVAAFSIELVFFIFTFWIPVIY